MVINEIFLNPTVKKVFFQITFPNLFSIESKIGDYQSEIINYFPQSSFSYKLPTIFFTDVGPEGKIVQPPQGIDDKADKIWQFKSESNYNLNISSGSLSLDSQLHKTYNNPSSEIRFRDIIKKTLEPFFKIIRIPRLNRIGLRYIDHCTAFLPDPLTDSNFKNWYNTVFPLDRFSIEKTKEMGFRVVSKQKDYHIIYYEHIILDDNVNYIIDFDGFAENVPSESYLTIADELHTIISEEFERTIKKPVFDLMRTPIEVNKDVK